jgi:hypothetical protein
MTRKLKLTSVLVLAAFALAACDDNDNDDGDANGGDPQDQFGSTFSTAFNADANDEPIDLEPGDAGALSPTKDPVDF